MNHKYVSYKPNDIKAQEVAYHYFKCENCGNIVYTCAPDYDEHFTSVRSIYNKIWWELKNKTCGELLLTDILK